MTEQLALSATTREEHGKANSRRLRHQGKLPAVIYGGKKGASSLLLDHNEASKALKNKAIYSHVLSLDVDGKSESVILKAVQRHPIKPRLLHLDFLRINAKEEMTMSVPFNFIGEDKAPGIKQGGILSRLMTEIEIKCLPANLPEGLDVDLSALELDHSVHLADITLPKGVELTQPVDEDHNPGIVNVHKPKEIKEDDETEAEQAAGEPEGGSDAAE